MNECGVVCSHLEGELANRLQEGQSLLIATGGTVKAAAELLVEGGAVPVGVFAVIGLPFLQYEKSLEGLPVRTLIEYFGE